jgi:hypothetical protein
MSRTNFGLTTSSEEIATVCSKNEFLEVPIISIVEVIVFVWLKPLLIDEIIMSTTEMLSRCNK